MILSPNCECSVSSSTVCVEGDFALSYYRVRLRPLSALFQYPCLSVVEPDIDKYSDVLALSIIDSMARANCNFKAANPRLIACDSQPISLSETLESSSVVIPF